VKEYSYIKRAILRELSEDSRISVSALAKKLKCARNTVISNMDTLEKEFGVHYTLEFNKEKLGLSQNQIWSIKLGKKAELNDIKRIFKDDNVVQFVAETEGDFDLLINIVADSTEGYLNWGMKTALQLLPYRPTVRASVISMVHTGYIPIQNAVLESLDLSLLDIDKLDKRILMLLNEDSRLTYSAIAKGLDEDVETIRYRLRKIAKTKIINRFTVVLEKPPTEYNMAFFLQHEFTPGIIERYKKARDYYLDIDGKLPIMNTFQYLALTSGSYLTFGIGCFETEEDAIRKGVLAHRELFKEDSAIVYFAKITNVTKGYLPIRSIDIVKDFRPLKLS
jgi:DNA-binding Lrp family transcriptional regulator